LGLHPSLAEIGSYLALIFAGLLVHYAVLMGLVSLTFWIIQAESVLLGYYTIFHVARIPREAATGWFRIAFTFAIPLLLVANVPASSLIRGLEPGPIFLFLFSSVVVAVLATSFFLLGLRRYQSASS
jgi:ABC-2 type transport system permease protein